MKSSRDVQMPSPEGIFHRSNDASMVCSASDTTWFSGGAGRIGNLLPIVKGDANGAAPFRQEGPRAAVL